jgi:hypothetical protein
VLSFVSIHTGKTIEGEKLSSCDRMQHEAKQNPRQVIAPVANKGGRDPQGEKPGT